MLPGVRSPDLLDLIEHLARHQVTVDDVEQLLRNGFRVERNRKMQVADFILVGRTNGGRILEVAASWADPPDDDRLHIHTAYDA